VFFKAFIIVHCFCYFFNPRKTVIVFLTNVFSNIIAVYIEIFVHFLFIFY